MLISVHGILNKTKFNTQLNIQGTSREHGFTLLELMVVIVIVAILFSFATLTIRSSSPEDLIEKEARRLDRLIQLALEEAVLKNTEYGLEFNQKGYRFLAFNEGKWQPLTSDKLLRQRELPEEMAIELFIEQTDVVIDENAKTSGEDEGTDHDVTEKAKPQVFLLSSEELTPEFSARFSLRGIETSYIVSGSVDGKHEVKLSDY